MNVYITGRNVKITPDVRQHIEKNIKKLDHYIDHIYDFKLTLKKERHIISAEVNINVKKKIIHIFARTEDIFSVIDMLFDKIEVKIRRYRDKLISKRVVPVKEATTQVSSVPLLEVEETA